MRGGFFPSTPYIFLDKPEALILGIKSTVNLLFAQASTYSLRIPSAASPTRIST